jgi:hypothetical protein
MVLQCWNLRLAVVPATAHCALSSAPGATRQAQQVLFVLQAGQSVLIIVLFRLPVLSISLIVPDVHLNTAANHAPAISALQLGISLTRMHSGALAWIAIIKTTCSLQVGLS